MSAAGQVAWQENSYNVMALNQVEEASKGGDGND